MGERTVGLLLAILVLLVTAVTVSAQVQGRTWGNAELTHNVLQMQQMLQDHEHRLQDQKGQIGGLEVRVANLERAVRSAFSVRTYMKQTGKTEIRASELPLSLRKAEILNDLRDTSLYEFPSNSDGSQPESTPAIGKKLSEIKEGLARKEIKVARIVVFCKDVKKCDAKAMGRAHTVASWLGKPASLIRPQTGKETATVVVTVPAS